MSEDSHSGLNCFWPLTLMGEPRMQTTEWRTERRGRRQLRLPPSPFFPVPFISGDLLRGSNSKILAAKNACAQNRLKTGRRRMCRLGWTDRMKCKIIRKVVGEGKESRNIATFQLCAHVPSRTLCRSSKPTGNHRERPTGIILVFWNIRYSKPHFMSRPLVWEATARPSNSRLAEAKDRLGTDNRSQHWPLQMHCSLRPTARTE
jgi:hypothetical protein